MIIKKNIFIQTTFEELKIGDCFKLNRDTDASIFLKVNSNNSSKNAVNLTKNMLTEISSNTVTFPVKAILTIEL